MENRFHVRLELCIACKSCELACAFTHSSLQGQPGKSRINIKVIKADESRLINTPLICLQCDEAACATICPTNALQWNLETGALVHHDLRCVRCHLCVAACPFGNIYFDPVTDYPVKCDLCDGDPMCVKFCPSGAITWLPLTEAEVNRIQPEINEEADTD